MKRHIFSVLAVALLGASMLFAQTTEFTYQGKLTSTGTPATGLHDFEFSLYDAVTGGTLAGTVSRNNVAVANGIFTVALDFGDQYPRFNHLEISVKQSGGGTFTTLSPRQPIKSAPTAVASLKSATADNALLFRGEPPSSFVAEGDARLTDARNPLAGSASYIQNMPPTVQAGSSFNISGNGTAGGTLSGNLVDSATQFNLGGLRFAGVTTEGTSTFLGLYTGPNSIGAGNTFVGRDAGFTNLSGSQNSFFGSYAGRVNNASLNSFFGHYTGTRNTSGLGNSFFGSGSASMNGPEGTGAFNTTGNFNSFFGHRAGEANTTASVNSFFGTGAGFANTTGGSNSFFGHDTGNSNTTGSFNSALGKNADVTGGDLQFATAIGAEALAGTSDTIVIGKVAGTYNGVPRPADAVQIPGNLNVAGVLNANGSTLNNLNASNIHIAGTNQFNLAQFRVSALSVQGESSFGAFQSFDATALTGGKEYLVFSTGNNAGEGQGKFVIKNQTNNLFHLTADTDKVNLQNGAFTVLNNGNVGVNNSSPTARFQVDGNTQITGGSLSLIGGTFNNFSTSGTSNTYMKAAAAQNGINFGVAANTGTDSTLFISHYDGANYQDRLIINANGNVGIGTGITTNLNSQSLTVRGGIAMTEIAAGGTTELCRSFQSSLAIYILSFCSSSIRYKQNINNFTHGLDLVRRLRPVSFNWKSNNSDDMGLVAEEVAEIEPLLVTYNKGEIEGVKYDRVGVVLVNAVKEQQAQIEAQQKQIDEQKEIIERQQQQLDGLKLLICSQNQASAATSGVCSSPKL